MKRTEEKPRKHCPICGSHRVEWFLPQDWSRWECKECGYRGALVIEDGEMSKKIREKYLEGHKK
jgi:transposase-like protein